MKTAIVLTLFSITSSLFAAGAVPAAELKMNQTPAANDQPKLQSYMMIDPKARANDLLQAFDILRKEKNSSKVYFQISGDRTISNIIDMSLMNNGNLILFRYNSPQGIQLEAIPVEDIVSINHL